ncbi:MAG: DUF1508 domain-containing protein [Clostridia bacterium]|nr:DUF1508 domain-containing protein [Clostridia bacterium]
MFNLLISNLIESIKGWIVENQMMFWLLVAIFVILVAIIITAIACAKAKKKKAKTEATEKLTEKEVLEKLSTSPEQKVKDAVNSIRENEIEPVKEKELEEKTLKEEEKVEAKAEPKEEEPKEEPKKEAKKKEPKQLLGKWVVEEKTTEEYIFKLLASNGEVMLTSEIYSTEEGARNGIATIIKNIELGKFVIYNDKNKKYYYKLKSAQNKLLCVGEIYQSQEQCNKAVETVKRIAKNSKIAEKVVEGNHYIDYVPLVIDKYEVKKGTNGKWKIEKDSEGNYLAKLYASNGQVMLATEGVASKTSAKTAITSVKKNSKEGNFIIDKDKFGRFYYKLRNAKKSVICIGETYEKLESCISALESVRRFAETAIIEE